jgi:pilus assembly protein Flp/PilA
MKEVNTHMMLEAYTYVRVAASELRRAMHERFSDLVGSETGATAAEYGVLVALIAAVIIVGATFLGTQVNTTLNDVGGEMPAVP